MPAQKTASVLAKYGQRIKEAVAKARENPVDYGFAGGLPPGLLGAVCQLSECGFFVVEAGKQNAGEAYYREVGVVQWPVMHVDPRTGNPVKVQGRQTSGIVMCCDTQRTDPNTKVISGKSFQDNWDDICNRLRMLGGEDCIPEGADGPTIEAIAGQIKAAKPFFHLDTSLSRPQLDTIGPNKGKPKIDSKTGKPYELRVWENWRGSKGLENWALSEPGQAFSDDTGHVNGQAPAEVADAPDAPQEVASSGAGEQDLDVLAALADGGDEGARKALEDMGRACGYDIDDLGPDGQPNNPPQDPFVQVQSWAEAVALIRTGGPAGASAEPEPAAAPAALAATTQVATKPAPKKGDVVKYRLRGPDGKPAINTKTKTPVKAEDYEIASVNLKEQTVGLKNSTTQKFHIDANKKVIQVPWSDLE